MVLLFNDHNLSGRNNDSFSKILLPFPTISCPVSLEILVAKGRYCLQGGKKQHFIDLEANISHFCFWAPDALKLQCYLGWLTSRLLMYVVYNFFQLPLPHPPVSPSSSSPLSVLPCYFLSLVNAACWNADWSCWLDRVQVSIVAVGSWAQSPCPLHAFHGHAPHPLPLTFFPPPLLWCFPSLVGRRLI